MNEETDMDMEELYNIDRGDFEPHFGCPECGSEDFETVEPEGEMGFTWIEGHIDCNDCEYVGPAEEL